MTQLVYWNLYRIALLKMQEFKHQHEVNDPERVAINLENNP